MRGKGLIRDLVLIAFGASIATVVSVQADTTSEQGGRDETPDLYAITCGDGEITGVTVSEGRMDTVTLAWFANSVTSRQNGAVLTDCVISMQ